MGKAHRHDSAVGWQPWLEHGSWNAAHEPEAETKDKGIN